MALLVFLALTCVAGIEALCTPGEALPECQQQSTSLLQTKSETGTMRLMMEQTPQNGYLYLGAGECRMANGQYGLQFKLPGSNACQSICNTYAWCFAYYLTFDSSCYIVTDSKTYKSMTGQSVGAWGDSVNLGGVNFQTYACGSGTCSDADAFGTGKLKGRYGFQCWVKSSTPAAISTTAAPAGYTFVQGQRCTENAGYLPVDYRAQFGTTSWNQQTIQDALAKCSADPTCQGVMTIGSQYPGDWINRPQFCSALSMSSNSQWNSYVKR